MELEISGIRKTYKGYDGEPDFSLYLPATLSLELGKTVFIMGHNGSGKSLLFKLLSGEIIPSSDYIKICNGAICWKAHEHPFAVVRQRAEDSLALDLTVKENLAIRLKPTSLFEKIFPTIKGESYFKDLLKKQIALAEKLDQLCRNLSGGQKQTLAFVVVSLQKLPILFLDEFLSATDINTSSLLRDLAKDYAKSTPACVLIISHDIDMALKDADRILILKSGNLIKDMTPHDEEWSRYGISQLLSK